MPKQQQVTSQVQVQHVMTDCSKAASIDHTDCLFGKAQEYNNSLDALQNQMMLDCLAYGPTEPSWDDFYGELTCQNGGTIRGFDDNFLKDESNKYFKWSQDLTNPIPWSYGGCFVCNAVQIEGRPPLSSSECQLCVNHFLTKVRELMYDHYRKVMECKQAYQRRLRDCSRETRTSLAMRVID